MASAFETAFAAARKAGKSNFSFGGKSYNTKLKSEAVKRYRADAPLARQTPVTGPKARPVAKAVAATGDVARGVAAAARRTAGLAGGAASPKARPSTAGKPRTAIEGTAKTATKAQTPVSSRYSGARATPSTGIADRMKSIREGNDKQRKAREAARKARRSN
jgi:hypothetical protein